LTCARLTYVRRSARIAVTAAGAVRKHGIGANAAARVAGTGRMAPVGCRAYHWIASGAEAAFALVSRCASIAVIAASAIRRNGVRAGAIGRIACSSHVAGVRCGANNRIGAHTGADLTGVRLCTGVAVAASGAVWCGNVGTSAVGGIARSSHVAGVLSRACYRTATRADAVLTAVGLSADIAVRTRGTIGR
jgi:hypothetical protein